MSSTDHYLEEVKKAGNFWFVKRKYDDECKKEETQRDKNYELINKIYEDALTVESQVLIDEIKCCGGFRSVCENLVAYYYCTEERNLDYGLHTKLKNKLANDKMYEPLFSAFSEEEKERLTRRKRTEKNWLPFPSDFSMNAAKLFQNLGIDSAHKDSETENAYFYRHRDNLVFARERLHKVLFYAFGPSGDYNDFIFREDYCPIGDWFIEHPKLLLNEIPSILAYRKVNPNQRPHGLIYKYSNNAGHEELVQTLTDSGLPNYELIKKREDNDIGEVNSRDNEASLSSKSKSLECNTPQKNDNENNETIFAYTFSYQPYLLKANNQGETKKDKLNTYPPETKIKLCVKLASDLKKLHREHKVFHRALNDVSIVIEFDKNNNPNIHIVNFSLAKIVGSATVFDDLRGFLNNNSQNYTPPEAENMTETNADEDFWCRWDVFSLAKIYRDILGDIAGIAVDIEDIKENYNGLGDNFWKLLDLEQLLKDMCQEENTKRPSIAQVEARLLLPSMLKELKNCMTHSTSEDSPPKETTSCQDDKEPETQALFKTEQNFTKNDENLISTDSLPAEGENPQEGQESLINYETQQTSNVSGELKKKRRGNKKKGKHQSQNPNDEPANLTPTQPRTQKTIDTPMALPEEAPDEVERKSAFAGFLRLIKKIFK